MILLGAAYAATFDFTATAAYQTDNTSYQLEEATLGNLVVPVDAFVPPVGVRLGIRPGRFGTGFMVGFELRGWRHTWLREPSGWSLLQLDASIDAGMRYQAEPGGMAARPYLDFGFSLAARAVQADWFPLAIGPAIGTRVGGGVTFGTGPLRPLVGIRGAASLTWMTISGNSEGTAQDFYYAYQTTEANIGLVVGVEWGGRSGVYPVVVDAGT